MPINLGKGQRVSLDSSMKLAHVGLGWNTKKYSGGADFDLDASLFLLNLDEKVARDEDFIFYNNLRGRNDAVVHTGDNLVGGTGGDDEVIVINFPLIPSDIQKIVIAVTIHDAENRKQNFGQVSNAYVRVAKMTDEFDTAGESVLRFDLEDEFSTETALIVCEIYRRDSEWRFNAVAGGVKGGLDALCRRYGVDLA